MEQSDFERDLELAVYGLRLLVITECEATECQGGGRHFHQVHLTREQFKKVSDACVNSVVSEGDGWETCTLQLSEETLPTEPFDRMTDFYE